MSSARVRGTLLFLLWLVGLWGPARFAWAGAEDCPKGTEERLPVRVLEIPRFEADVAYFAEDAKTYRVEAWLSVLNDDLQFVRDDGGFQAQYEVTVIINDRGGRQVRGDQIRQRRQVATYEETNETRAQGVDLITLRVPPGEYGIVFRVQDVESGIESEAEQKIVLPETEKGVSLSSLKFLEGAAGMGPADAAGAALVGRAYGDSLPIARMYVELYGVRESNGPAELDYRTSGEEEGGFGASGVARSLSGTADGRKAYGQAYLVEFSTDSLSIGTHTLKVLARQGRETLAATCGVFQVLSSEALWWRDFDEMLDLLSYIATKEELDKLKAAPEDKRRQAWEDFWAARDPTPGTERNEVRREFFERVSYANRHFGEMMAKGWQTDRGRIYITEGPPDNIESHPMDLSGNPWEAWYYERRGITYIFVDRSGFGQYVLVGTR